MQKKTLEGVSREFERKYREGQEETRKQVLGGMILGRESGNEQEGNGSSFSPFDPGLNGLIKVMKASMEKEFNSIIKARSNEQESGKNR